MPIGNLMASLGGNGILTFDGIRRAESQRRSKYESVTINQKIGHQVLASPVIDWNDTELWLYILTRRINFCDVYRSGFSRVGCMYCPFNGGLSEYLIHAKYEKFGKKWNIFLESFAKKINYNDITKFKNYGWKVRAGARGLEINPTKINKNECFEDKNAYSYELSAWQEVFFEYLKPFGILSCIYDDGTIWNIHNYLSLNKDIKRDRIWFYFWYVNEFDYDMFTREDLFNCVSVALQETTKKIIDTFFILPLLQTMRKTRIGKSFGIMVEEGTNQFRRIEPPPKTSLTLLLLHT